MSDQKRCEGSVVLNFGKKNPAGGFLELGMSFQELFHLKDVLFRFDAACGIEEGPSGTDQRSQSVQNFF